jgi:hypothetical protein
MDHASRTELHSGNGREGFHGVRWFKGAIEKPDRSCNDLGLWVQVGVLGAMRLARGRDEDPVAFAENTQTLADLPTAADLPPALGPGEGDAALLASRGAKRVEPVPVVAAEVEERGHPFVAIDFENENAGVRPGDESPVWGLTRPVPQLLQIVRCLGEARMRHGKMHAEGNGEKPPAIPMGGTINLDRNPVYITRFVLWKRLQHFNGAQPLLKRCDECFC